MICILKLFFKYSLLCVSVLLTGKMKSFSFFIVFFCGFLTVTFAAELRNSNCLEKEKALTLLEIAENLLTKARISFPSCKNDINSTENSDCSAKKPLSYIEISKKIISDVRQNFPTCSKLVEEEDKIIQFEKYNDCSEILANGHYASGVYTVWPIYNNTANKPLKVYCDMETDNGGWTVIQRRGKYPVQQNFSLDWESYKNGFGNLTEEFWLGNENIRILCLKGCELRIDLQDAKGEKGFAHYQSFSLSGSDYRIKIEGYNGNIEDAMIVHRDQTFCTKDQDKEGLAKELKGGWWYLRGYYNVNLNGIYQPGISSEESIMWFHWRKKEGLARVVMKIRPKKI